MLAKKLMCCIRVVFKCRKTCTFSLEPSVSEGLDLLADDALNLQKRRQMSWKCVREKENSTREMNIRVRRREKWNRRRARRRERNERLNRRRARRRERNERRNRRRARRRERLNRRRARRERRHATGKMHKNELTLLSLR